MTLEELHELPLSLLLEAVDTHPTLARDSFRRDRAAVIGHIANIWKISPKLLLGRKRPAWIAEPRMAGMATLRELGHSLVATGLAFNRDHGTVMSAKKRVTELYDLDSNFAHRLQQLRTAVALPPQLH